MVKYHEMRDDEFTPKCPKCGHAAFVAVNNAYVHRTSFAIPMIVCANLECQAVLGVLPKEAVWPD